MKRRQKQEEYRKQLDNPPVAVQESRRPVQRFQDGGGGGDGGSDFLPGETESEVAQRRRMKQEEYRRQLDMGAAAAPIEETRASRRGRNPPGSEDSSGGRQLQLQQQQQQEQGENEETVLRRMRQDEYRRQLDNPPTPMQESRRPLQRTHVDANESRGSDGQLQAQMEMMQQMPTQVYSSPINAAAEKRMRQQEYADQLRSDSASADAAAPEAPSPPQYQQDTRDRSDLPSETVDRRIRQQEYADQLRADAAALAHDAPPSRSELLAYQQSQQSAAPLATAQAPMGVHGHEHELQRAPKVAFSHTPPPARRHPSQMSDAHPLRSPAHAAATAAAAAAAVSDGTSGSSPAKAGQMRFGGFAGEEDDSNKRRSKYAQYRIELDAQVKEAEARKAAEKKLDEAYFGGDDALALKVRLSPPTPVPVPLPYTSLFLIASPSSP
jgi:hypothetical protein